MTYNHAGTCEKSGEDRHEIPSAPSRDVPRFGRPHEREKNKSFRMNTPKYNHFQFFGISSNCGIGVGIDQRTDLQGVQYSSIAHLLPHTARKLFVRSGQCNQTFNIYKHQSILSGCFKNNKVKVPTKR